MMSMAITQNRATLFHEPNIAHHLSWTIISATHSPSFVMDHH
jgi:hypothetical protein